MTAESYIINHFLSRKFNQINLGSKELMNNPSNIFQHLQLKRNYHVHHLMTDEKFDDLIIVLFSNLYFF